MSKQATLCAGVRRNGQPCRQTAVADQPYCRYHQAEPDEGQAGGLLADLFTAEELSRLQMWGREADLSVELGSARLALVQAVRREDIPAMLACVNTIVATARAQHQLNGQQANNLLTAAATILEELGYGKG